MLTGMGLGRSDNDEVTSSVDFKDTKYCVVMQALRRNTREFCKYTTRIPYHYYRMTFIMI